MNNRIYASNGGIGSDGPSGMGGLPGQNGVNGQDSVLQVVQPQSASRPASEMVVLAALQVVVMSNHEAAMGGASVRISATKTAQVPGRTSAVGGISGGGWTSSGVTHATFPLGSIRLLGWLVQPAQSTGGLGANTLLGAPSQDWQGSSGETGIDGSVGGGGGGGVGLRA